MRGVDVTIPDDPQRVVAMSRDLINTEMYILGVDDKIVGGSISKTPVTMGQYVWNGKDYSIDTRIGKILTPKLDDENVLNVGGLGTGPFGKPNIESIAKLNPDLLILRDMCSAKEDTEKFISQIESIGIPVVVLRYPDCYSPPSVDTIYDEIRLISKIFKNEKKAEKIVATMQKAVEEVTSKTKDISEDQQKKVLYFGAPTSAIGKGGVGQAFGPGTVEIAQMEDLVKAQNVYPEKGNNLISAEQMLASDPDVIILPTWSGYHPPRQLDEGNYTNIQEMRAIKNKEVYSLTATPCKSERLEFPINLMIAAKVIYPDKFADVDLKSWIHDYIKELYNSDEATTQKIMDALMLEYLEIVK